MVVQRLPNGREISVVEFRMTPTYAGLLEGSRETASPHIVEGLREEVVRLLPSGQPLVMIPPPRMPLPDWLVVAQLHSRRGVRTTDPEFYSVLFACWFVGDTSQSVDDMVAAILPFLNWEQEAEDVEIG